MMPVAILAGGLATRLRPLTGTIPKSLIPVNGEPFISLQLRLLKSRGVERVVLCLGYLSEKIQEFVGGGEVFGLKVDYSWDGPVQLGTAGALRNALPLLGEAFFVVYGDSYLPCDYRAAEEFFIQSGKMGLMTVFRNEGRFDTSNVEFLEGTIRAYDKRALTPRMLHIDYGLGAFRASVFASMAPTPCDLATIYQDLLGRGELAGMEMPERFYETGSFEGIQELTAFLSGSGSLEKTHQPPY
jgi:NDP-sugar pyrophosphorylase family protein